MKTTRERDAKGRFLPVVQPPKNYLHAIQFDTQLNPNAFRYHGEHKTPIPSLVLSRDGAPTDADGRAKVYASGLTDWLEKRKSPFEADPTGEAARASGKALTLATATGVARSLSREHEAAGPEGV